MDNEELQGFQTDEQTDNPSQEQAEQPEVPQDPQNLSEAFRALRGVKQEGTQTPVAEPESEPEPEPIAEPEPSIQRGAGDAPRESTDDFQSFDTNSEIEALNQSLSEMAERDIDQMFEQEGIHTWSVADLYRRDDKTGDVTFVDPEHPSRPFQTRQDAQNWCDSMNRDIERARENYIKQRTAEYKQSCQATYDLLEFIPEYNQMSEAEQNAFEDIIEGFEVYDENNDIIGYSCNLKAMAKKARTIANKYGTRQPEQGHTPSGPAVNMKSSSSASKPKDKEMKDPTNLSEAMSMLKKMKGSN